MADGSAAHDPERLPWLSDTRRSRRGRDSASWLFWAFLAIVLVAGISYWLGMKSARSPDEMGDLFGRAPPVAADPLPEAERANPLPPPAPAVEAPGLREVPPLSEAAPVPIPGVQRARPPEPAAAPVVTPEPAPAETPEAAPQAAAKPEVSTAEPKAGSTTAARPAAPRPARLQAWPADQSTGAYGRVVRVGTFYSRRQAKQGWARVVRVYPGIRRLRAVVVPIQSLRNGQTYYRLQFGTTSQAHSEILCQRMRVVGQSCVTVGLLGKGARG